MVFKIGTFKEKLEIKTGIRLSGYPNTEKRLCKGSKNDIEVNGLILNNGFSNGILISIDIIGIELSFTNKIREKIEKEFKIPFDNIILSCTHTHSGPVTIGRIWKIDNEFL
ncbi:MAG: hypothetical protein ACP5H7_03200, partial [Minisyncoccia bacterium]